MASDLELLERVDFAFALADQDEKFEKTLGTFLVPLLLKGASPDAAVKQKLMSTLSHINVRLKQVTGAKLPTAALVAQFLDNAVPAAVKNFTIIYVEMGMARMTPDEKLPLAQKLVSGFADRVLSQRLAIFHILLPILGRVQIAEQQDKDARVFQDWLLYVLLYALPVSNGAAGAAPVRGAPASGFGRMVEVPPTLSPDANDIVTRSGRKVWTFEDLLAAKLSVLKFVDSAPWPEVNKLPHFIVASVDPQMDPVSREGDSLFKRLQNVSLEDATVVNRLFALYMGDASTVPAASRQPMAHTDLKHKLLRQLQRSAKAANTFPAFLQVTFDALFGEDTNPRLCQQGASFLQWIARMSSDEVITPVAPMLLRGVTKLIAAESDEQGESQIRNYAFVSLGLIMRRVPSLARTNVDLLETLFASLATENGGAKLSAQEALANIIPSLLDLPELLLERIRTLLLKNVTNTNAFVRVMAMRYVADVLPPQDAVARLLCVVATGDTKNEVRELGLQGLHVPSDPAKRPSFASLLHVVWRIFDDDSFVPVQQAGSSPALRGLCQPAYRNLLRYARLLLLVESGATVTADLVRYDEGQDDEPILSSSKLRAHLAELESAGDAAGTAAQGRMLELLKAALVPTNDLLLVATAGSMLREFVVYGSSFWPAGLKDTIRTLRQFELVANDAVRTITARLYATIFVRNASGANDPSVETAARDQIALLAVDEKRTVRAEVRHFAMVALGYLISETAVVRGVSDTSFLLLAAPSVYPYLSSRETFLQLAACESVAEMGRFFPMPPLDGTPLLKHLSALLAKATDAKVQERFALTIGHVAVGEPDEDLCRQALDALRGCAEVKRIDLQLTIGEAMCNIVCRWSSERLAGLPQPLEFTGPRDALCDKLISDIMESHVTNPRPNHAMASSAWLLSLVKFGGSSPGVLARLKDLHSAFARLLNDRDDTTQECASRGLGVVYDLGTADMRDELVRSLLGTFSATRAQQTLSGAARPDAAMFDEPLATTADGGTVSTYRELCSLVTELNQPDLMYKFMNLASQSALWNSRRGAAFGFGAIAGRAREQLKPHLREVVPKLFRYRFDPTPRVHEAMDTIWKAIVDDPRKAVEDAFPEIMADIMPNLGNRMWRVREASACALTDLMHGRSVQDFKAYLSDMWFMTLRVMDDIKESVRKAGVMCARSLTAMTMRAIEPSSPEARSRETLELVIPFLLEQGVVSSSEEAKALSLDTLVKICKQASPAPLRPFVVQIASWLLEALSGLEPQVLNYLSFHVGKYELSPEQLDKSRLAATRSSPSMEAIEACLDRFDDACMEAFSPKLQALLRKGIGLPTKAGSARVVALLCFKSPALFKPHAPAILKALSGTIVDKNAAVRSSMITALAQTTALVDAETCGKLVKHLRKIYMENADSDLHGVAGQCIYEISKHAGPVLRECLSDVIPLLFVARFDADTAAAAAWTNAWEELNLESKGTLRLYRQEIVALMADCLASTSWPVRQQGALAVAAFTEKAAADTLVAAAEPISRMLLDGLAGRVWQGKDALPRAVVALLSKAQKAAEEDPALSAAVAALPVAEISEALYREAGKRDLTYRRAVLESLIVLHEQVPCANYAAVADVIHDVLAPMEVDAKAAPAKRDDDEADDEPKTGPLTYLCAAAALRLSAAAVAAADPPVDPAEALAVHTRLVKFAGDPTWAVRQGAYGGLETLFKRLPSLEALQQAHADFVLAAASLTLRDERYSSVKAAHIKALAALASRDDAAVILQQHGTALADVVSGFLKDGSPAEVADSASALLAVLRGRK